MRPILRSLLFLVVLLTPLTADSQWSKVVDSIAKFNPKQGGGSLRRAGNHLWVGSHGLLKLSTDLGATWRDVTPPSLGDNVVMDIATSGLDIVVVASQKASWLTTDRGVTWDSLPPAISCFVAGGMILLADGGLQRSMDLGQTWQRIPLDVRFITQIYFGGGRFWLKTAGFGISDLNGRHYYSENLGEWQTEGGTTTYDSYSMLVDSCDRDLLISVEEEWFSPKPGKGSNLVRSSDRGKTWQYVFWGPRGYVSGDLALSAGVMYATTMHNGILASVDKGLSWRHIGGPSIGFADTRFLTVINERYLLAMDSMGTLWRGDISGLLHVGTGRLWASQDTIRMSVCDTAFVDILADRYGCSGADSVKFTYTTIPGLRQKEARVDLLPTVLGSTKIDGLATGTHRFVLKATRKSYRGTSQDSAVVIVIVADGETKSLSVSPDSIAFNMYTFCELDPESRKIELHNLGCDDIRILDVRLEGNTEAFEVDPLQLLLRDDTSTNVRYKPESPGAHSALLILRSELGEDTIFINGVATHGEDIAVSLASKELYVSECDSTDQDLLIGNGDCQTLIVESVILDGMTFQYDPLVLAARDTARLKFILDSRKSRTVTLRLLGKKIVGADSVAIDTTISFSIIVDSALTRVLIDPLLIDGSVVVCKDTVLSLSMVNPLCRDISDISTVLLQNKHFELDRSSLSLMSGRKEDLLISFRADVPGLYRDTVVIRVDDTTYSVPLSLLVTAGDARIVSNLTSLDFGELIAGCEDSVLTIEASNLACFALRLDSGRCAPPFELLDVPPDDLQAGESVTLRVRYSPDRVVLDNGLLRLYYFNGERGDSIDIELLGKGIQRPSLSVETVAPLVAVDAGDTVTIRFTASMAGWLANNASSNAMIALKFNTDLLTPVAVRGVNGLDVQQIAADPQGYTYLVEGLAQLPREALFFPLFELDLRATIASELKTTIQVLYDQDVYRCAEITADPANLEVAIGCSDSTLLRMLRNEELLKIESIKPNPARTFIEARLTSRDEVIYEMINTLGQSVLTGHGSSGEIQIDVSNLPRGGYDLIFRSMDQVRSRKVVLR